VKLLLGGVIRPKAVVVPRMALNQGAKGYFVWVIKPDMTVEYRDVDEGEWVDEGQFILKGLAPAEQIVVGGGLKLSSGMKVRVKKYISDSKTEPSGSGSNRPVGG
jgi:multidrug efflux pump subunit AcrA (membrane-fusion protein)